jgi:FkbM family methyltransferase
VTTRSKGLRGRLGVLPWIWNHPANRGRRLRRVATAAAFQVRGRVLGRSSLATVGRSARLVAEVGWASAAKAVYANPPDWPEMLVWRERLRPGDLFVDVGANVGTYSLWAADLGARIIAVEPNPEAVTRLRRNLTLNGVDAEVVEAALTDHTGLATFDPTGGTTARLSTRGIAVRATTLDEVLAGRRAAGVKVDVEGHERLVVAGAAESLRERRIGCLQLEWHTLSWRVLGETREPIVELLRRYGYGIYRPDETGRLRPDAGDFGRDVFALPLEEP